MNFRNYKLYAILVDLKDKFKNRAVGLFVKMDKQTIREVRIAAVSGAVTAAVSAYVSKYLPDSNIEKELEQTNKELKIKERSIQDLTNEISHYRNRMEQYRFLSLLLTRDVANCEAKIDDLNKSYKAEHHLVKELELLLNKCKSDLNILHSQRRPNSNYNLFDAFSKAFKYGTIAKLEVPTEENLSPSITGKKFA